MDFTQGSLFDALGIDFDSMAEGTRKKEKKKEKTKSTKPASSKKKNTPETISLPVEVFTGYQEPFAIDMADLGTDKVTEEELKKVIAKKVPHMTVANMVLMLKEKKCFVGIKAAGRVAKGTIKVTKDSKLFMPNGEVGPSLSSIMADEECTLDLEEVGKLLPDKGLASGFSLTKGGNDFIVLPGGEALDSKKELTLPLEIAVYGRSSVQVTKESIDAFVNTDTSVTGKLIEEYFVSKYPEFKGHISLKTVKGQPQLLVAVFTVEEPKKAGAAKTMYPTEDVTLSFAGVNRVTLSAELFDGKTEVTEDELLEYCHSLYPEFKKGRTTLNYYREEKLIIPMIKGSTKGAFGLKVAESAEDFSRLETQHLPFLLRMKEQSQTFRVESTEVSLTVAAMEEAYAASGIYQLRLPKMSGKLYDKIDGFFRYIADIYGTEVLVRIFWNRKKKEYEIELPEQSVSPSSVQEESDDKDGVLRKPDCIAVAEFHSHCFYKAFFSSVDNEDELGNKIYGVLGDYSKTESNSILRAGTGGKYVYLQKKDIFTDERASQEEIDRFVRKFGAAADSVVHLL